MNNKKILQNEADNLLHIIQTLIIKRRQQNDTDQQQTNKKLSILYDNYYLRLQQIANIKE